MLIGVCVLFSLITKNELARILPRKQCCQQAELMALIYTDGCLTVKDDEPAALVLTTENAAVARKIYKLAKILFKERPGVQVRRKARLKKNNVYTIDLKAPYLARDLLAGETREWFS